MKKRVLSLLLVFVMVLGLLPTGVLAAEGITEISDQSGLAGMADGGSYILTQDIILSEWTAIDFSGTLDGNGHTITLAGEPLFNTLSGTVQNLLLNGEVSNEPDTVGALARTQAGGTVNNCWSGAVYDYYAYCFAGFVGIMTGGTIKNCLSTTEVCDAGLVAEASGQPTIENCYYIHYTAVSDGEFTGSGNEQITSSDYERIMVQLNGYHEDGLLYWAMDDGVPKPISPETSAVDRSELEALYKEAESMENAVPGEEDVTYTSESWAAFEAARTKAKEVLDDPDATQAAINEAKDNLQAAINGLIHDRTGSTEEQREVLRALIGSAPTEKGRYTDASWSAVQAALKPAVALLQELDATAEELTEQTTALQKAIEALTMIEDPAAVITPPEGQEWTMISTAEELAKISENGGNGYYKLANDITGYVGYYSWDGTYQQFNGVLDGNGYTVTFAGADKYPNPVINTLGPSGIIQNLGVNGSITNVPIVDKLYGKVINCYCDCASGQRPGRPGDHRADCQVPGGCGQEHRRGLEDADPCGYGFHSQ